MTEFTLGLIGEIRRRLSEVPKEASIDTLAWATELGSSSSLTVEQIRDVVRIEAHAAGVRMADIGRS
jgi:hypothetical protein